MARIVQEINLEVAKPNLFQAIVAKQNDYNSRFLKVTFVNNGEKINIDATLTATINAERPDGASKRFDAVVNDDGTVTAPLTGWMLELQGLVSCDISVITADGKLTTTDFSINVNEAACSDEDISNDDNYDILQELIVKVETLEENLDLSNYVEQTQYADINGNAGILRLKHTYGIGSGRYGSNSPESGDTATIVKATEYDIKDRKQNYRPIVPATLDYAVKMALTDSKIEWTEEEKKAVRILLGIETKDIVILDKAPMNGDGFVTGGQLEVGAKYIVTVYWDKESQYIVDNVECTAYEEINCPPNGDMFTGLICSCESFRLGTGEMYIQSVAENKLLVIFLFWGDEDGSLMPYNHTDSGTITLIKVNE